MKYPFASKSSHKLEAIAFIKKNPYCSIYRGSIKETPVIIKDYRDKSFDLVVNETNAIITYDSIAQKCPKWMDCKVIESIPEKNLLIMGFVPGCSLSQYIYKSFMGRFPQSELLDLVHSLGNLLREMYLTTKKNAVIDPFFAKYGSYCIEKLHKLPPWKKLFLRFEKNFPQNISDEQQMVSFVHGDFVPANIHVYQGKIGLIDFANSNYCSTISNDIYNFKLAISTMFITTKMKKNIIDTLYRGLGEIPEDNMEKFFYIYHVNRWLMLKAHSRNPLSLLNVIWNQSNIHSTHS